MENSFFVGISKQIVLQRNMEVIANNVANMSTTGFRAQNLLFKEHVSNAQSKENALSMVSESGQYYLTTPGAIKSTGSDFDVALNGPGFLAVEGPDGQKLYTRSGNFHMTADGQLLTTSGFPVAGGITIPEDATDISIDENGVISTQDGEIGQLEIVEFEDPQSLKPMGNTLYATDSETIAAENTRVIQGSLENSNVSGVIEMTRMIETLRSYQSLNRMITTENERVLNTIDRLTRV